MFSSGMSLIGRVLLLQSEFEESQITTFRRSMPSRASPVLAVIGRSESSTSRMSYTSTGRHQQWSSARREHLFRTIPAFCAHGRLLALPSLSPQRILHEALRYASVSAV